MNFRRSLIAACALVMLFICSASKLSARTVQSLSSPDGKIKIDVTLSGGITYDVYRGNALPEEDPSGA